MGPHPTRPMPICPAILPTTKLLGPTAPPLGPYPGTSTECPPSLGQPRPYRLPRNPLRIVELCRGLSTGLEALPKAVYAINFYAWVDIDPDVHAVVSHRLKLMRLKYPHLLPPEAIRDWNSQLPRDARIISPELFAATLTEGMDLLLASPPMLAHRLLGSHREHTPNGPSVVHRIV